MKKLAVLSLTLLLSNSALSRVLWQSSNIEIPSETRSLVEYEISKTCPRLMARNTLEVDYARMIPSQDSIVYALDFRGSSYNFNIEVETFSDERNDRVEIDLRDVCK